jgi:hypothetical protein
MLYGCETWSLTLRGESRLRRMLKWLFGHKREENGEWKILHSEELHSLYRSPNIIRVIKSRRLRWTGHVVRMEEGNSALKILTGKPTGKRPLGWPRRRWEENIRMDLRRSGCQYEELSWFDSGLLESPCKCGIKPLGSVSHGVGMM